MPGEGSWFIAMLALIAVGYALALQPMAHFRGAGVKSEEHGCTLESFRVFRLASCACLLTSTPT